MLISLLYRVLGQGGQHMVLRISRLQAQRTLFNSGSFSPLCANHTDHGRAVQFRPIYAAIAATLPRRAHQLGSRILSILLSRSREKHSFGDRVINPVFNITIRGRLIY